MVIVLLVVLIRLMVFIWFILLIWLVVLTWLAAYSGGHSSACGAKSGLVSG